MPTVGTVITPNATITPPAPVAPQVAASAPQPTVITPQPAPAPVAPTQPGVIASALPMRPTFGPMAQPAPAPYGPSAVVPNAPVAAGVVSGQIASPTSFNTMSEQRNKTKKVIRGTLMVVGSVALLFVLLVAGLFIKNLLQQRSDNQTQQQQLEQQDANTVYYNN